MKAATELISLSGRHVLITGAASGIGQAMALRFADAGAHLILIDINQDDLEKTQELIGQRYSVAVTSHVVDLGEKRQIDDLWQRLGDNMPDTLINSAGIYPMEDFLSLTAESLDHILSVNLTSMIWMCREFIQRRKKTGGNIINVSSIEALLPFTRDLIPYGVSKAGVLALTRGIARDFGKQGFRANVILPGAIETPSTSGLKKWALLHARFDLIQTGYNFQQRLTMPRWGKPDEVANVALFLASDLASYVQGAVIPVDGGFLSA